MNFFLQGRVGKGIRNLQGMVGKGIRNLQGMVGKGIQNILKQTKDCGCNILD
jgi:hypothetical protein